MNPSDPHNSAGMKTSTRERKRLTQIFAEHLPVVQEASLRLQEIMGVAPGDRVQEHLSPLPWQIPSADQVKDVFVQATRNTSVAVMGPPPLPPPHPAFESRAHCMVFNEAAHTSYTGRLPRMMHEKMIQKRAMYERVIHQDRLGFAQPVLQPASTLQLLPTSQQRPLSAKDTNYPIQYQTGYGSANLSNETKYLLQPTRSPHFGTEFSTEDTNQLKRKMIALSPGGHAVMKGSKVPKVLVDDTSAGAAPENVHTDDSMAAYRVGRCAKPLACDNFISGYLAKNNNRRSLTVYQAPRTLMMSSCDNSQLSSGFDEKPKPFPQKAEPFHPPLARADSSPGTTVRPPIIDMNQLMSSNLAFRPHPLTHPEKPPAGIQDFITRRKKSTYDPMANVPVGIPTDMRHRDISPIPAFEYPPLHTTVPKPANDFSTHVPTFEKQSQQGQSSSQCDTPVSTPSGPTGSDELFCCSGCRDIRSYNSCDAGNILDGGSRANDDHYDEGYHDEEFNIDNERFSGVGTDDVHNHIGDNDGLRDSHNPDSSNNCVSPQIRSRSDDHAGDIAVEDLSDYESESETGLSFSNESAWGDLPSEEQDSGCDEPPEPVTFETHFTHILNPSYFISSLSRILAAHLSNKNTLISSTNILKCSFFRTSPTDMRSAGHYPQSAAQDEFKEHTHIMTIAEENTSRLRVIRFILPELEGQKLMTDTGVLVDRLPRDWIVIETVDRAARDGFPDSSSDNDADRENNDPDDGDCKNGRDVESQPQNQDTSSKAKNIENELASPPPSSPLIPGQIPESQSQTDTQATTPSKTQSERQKDHKLPYYILAFPTQAITATDSRPTPRSQGQSSAQNVPDRFQTTTSVLAMGKRGRLPLVHTRGHAPDLLGEWVEACGRGEGVVGFEFMGDSGAWE